MKSRVVVLLPVKIGANEKIMVTLWFGCIWEIVTKRFPVRPRGHREIPTAVDSPDHERSFYKLEPYLKKKGIIDPILSLE